MARVAFALVALLAAAAVVSAEDDGQRVKRQYQRPATKKTNNPWEAISRADEPVIQYDASGLGFQINNPASFQSFHLGPIPFHHEPIKPFPFADPKPAYRPEPPKNQYKPEPPKHEPFKAEPYKPEPPKYKPEKPVYEPKPYQPKPDAYPSKPYQPSKYPADYAYCPKIGGLESQCRPTEDCAIWFDLIITIPDASCKLPDGTPGACCPSLPYNGKKTISPLNE